MVLIAYAIGVVAVWAVADRVPRLLRLTRELTARVPGAVRRIRELSARVPLDRLTAVVPRAPLSLRTIRFITMTVALSFVLATVTGTTGFIAQRGTIAFGASTTLTIIRGEVAVQPPDAPSFRAALDGDVVVAGTAVRTGEDAYAVITYFEGSTVSLDPATTLVIRALSLDPDGSTTIQMEQPAGRTWHAVQRLLSDGSRYELRTPSATAAVRGTAFSVQVVTAPGGEVVTVVQTTEGAVATRKVAEPGQPEPGEEVVVREGFRTTVAPSAPLQEPEPAPEPERTVTVSLDADAGIVLDSLGRANGVKDGKIVLQTPGARVDVVGGQLVVRLPDIPDGRVAAVLDEARRGRAVEVVTTVVQGGVVVDRVQERIVVSGGGVAAAAIELRSGAGAAAVERAPVTADEATELAASVKVAGPERREDAPTVGFFPPAASIPPLPRVAEERAAVAEREVEPASRARSGFVPQGTLPALPGFAQFTNEHAEPTLPPQAQERTREPARGSSRTPPPTTRTERTAPPRTTEPSRTVQATRATERPATQAPRAPEPTPPPPSPTEASRIVPAASLKPLPFGNPGSTPSAPPRGRP